MTEAVDTNSGEVVAITGVHPVADLFPILDDALDELTESIRARGQEDPIVLDADGRILDGRTRLAVCQRLDVKPTVRYYDGDDPDGYALTVNVARRSLSKGQKAMMIARARLLSNRSLSASADSAGISKTRVAQAATVIDYASHLVDDVAAGGTPLNDAYAEARKRKRAKESEATQLAEVREHAPDLADQIDPEDGRTLADVHSEFMARVAEARKTVRDLRSDAEALADSTRHLRLTKPDGKFALAVAYDEELPEPESLTALAETLRDGAEHAEQIAIDIRDIANV